jgi:hypothetical protein
VLVLTACVAVGTSSATTTATAATSSWATKAWHSATKASTTAASHIHKLFETCGTASAATHRVRTKHHPNEVVRVERHSSGPAAHATHVWHASHATKVWHTATGTCCECETTWHAATKSTHISHAAVNIVSVKTAKIVLAFLLWVWEDSVSLIDGLEHLFCLLFLFFIFTVLIWVPLKRQFAVSVLDCFFVSGLFNT